MLKPRSKIEVTKDLEVDFNIPEGEEVVNFPLHEIVDGIRNAIGLYMDIYEAPETGTELIFSRLRTNGEEWVCRERVYAGSWIDIPFCNTVKLSISTKGAYTAYPTTCFTK